MRESIGEQRLAQHILLTGLPEPEREFKFHPVRDWRVDFAWPGRKLAVEIEGAVYKIGRHQRPSGYMKDIEKYNELSHQGWRLLRYTTEQVIDGEAVNDIQRYLENHPCPES